MLETLRERDREESAAAQETPLFLERRDSRNLYPEIATPHEIVRKIKRVDPRWRVEWNRVRGRWFLYHDHERFGPAQTATLVVQDRDQRYMPLDHRVVRRIEFGAWCERNGWSVEKFDKVLQENSDRLDEQYEEAKSEWRRAWLRENYQGIRQHFADGTFYDPDPIPDPKVTVDYGARA